MANMHEGAKADQNDASAFLEICDTTFTVDFLGEYIDLEPFIRSIELLKDVFPTHTTALKTVVLNRLTGKAKECVPNEPDSVESIINALRNAIKPVSWKMVDKKMHCLKYKSGQEFKFKDKLDDLARAFNRSLVFEGYPRHFANEMTIEKTVEICRKNTDFSLVKAIVSATSFEYPEEVTAKFALVTIKESNDRAMRRARNYRRW